MNKINVFIHVFNYMNRQFSDSLVNGFCDTKSIDISLHTFVIKNKDQFNDFKRRGLNVILELSNSWIDVDYYVKRCDYCFVHNFPNNDIIFKMRKKYVKRIIWRFWGGDTLELLRYNNLGFTFNIKNKLRKIKRLLIQHKICKYVQYIGVSNIIDQLGFGISVPNNKFRYLSYLGKTIKITKEMKKDNAINIMVGHSGYRDENHIQIIDRLIEIVKVDDNINIYVPLSYGDVSYIQEVISYISSLTYKKIFPITNYYDYNSWEKFLSSIDIAIIDGTIAHALGNISSLVKYGSKLYLNESGYIAKGLTHENIPFSSMESLYRDGEEELVTLPKYNSSHTNVVHDFETDLANWVALITELLNNLKC